MKSHPLLTALHHTFLWFFTGSLTIGIMSLTYTIFGESINSSALATMIAITATTFIPYAIFFLIFWLQTKSKKQIAPDRIWSVWSIITICLHSLGLLGWSTALLVSLLVNDSPALQLGSGLALLVAALVAVFYSLITFVKLKQKPRFYVFASYSLALIALVGTLFVISIIKLGPIRHDESIKKEMVSTIQNIRDFVEDKDRLPNQSEAQPLVTDSRISYQDPAEYTYQLCADFKLDYSQYKFEDYSYAYGPGTTGYYISDDYIYEDQIAPAASGRQCFEITSFQLDPVYSEE